MICPYCNTQNRDDRETCYYCNKDLSLLRLIVNKAKHHYNLAVEHAQRNRYYEAITELRNSLDLDKNLLNARVLLGTIYAKQNKFDAAAREWEKALALNLQCQKAHNYIARARKAKASLPVIRWVKVSVGALAASFAIILVLLFYLLRPNPAEVLLENALTDYDNNFYGSALEKIHTFTKHHATSALAPIATSLAQSIWREIDGEKAKILNRMYSGKYWDALEMCKNLNGFHPDAQTVLFLNHIRKEAKFSIKKTIEDHLTEFGEEESNFETLKTEIENLSRYFPADKAADAFRDRLIALKEQGNIKELRILKNKLAQILSGEKPQEVLATLEEFNRQHPEFASKTGVTAKIRSLREARLSNQIEQILGYIEAGRLNQAQKAMAKLSHADFDGFPQEAKRWKKLKSILAKHLADYEKKRVAEFLTRIEAALKSRNVEEVLSLTARQGSYTFSPQQRTRLDAIIHQARARNAILTYNWIATHNLPDITQTISQDDARRILGAIPILKRDLPPETYRKVSDDLLFYACVSYASLGKSDKAREIFESFSREFPHSPYLRLAGMVLGD